MFYLSVKKFGRECLLTKLWRNCANLKRHMRLPSQPKTEYAEAGAKMEKSNLNFLLYCGNLSLKLKDKNENFALLMLFLQRKK